MHGELGGGLRPAWGYETRRVVWEAVQVAHRSLGGGMRGCLVVWKAVLDLHRGMRGARRSGRQSERCTVIWQAVLDPHGGMRGAW